MSEKFENLLFRKKELEALELNVSEVAGMRDWCISKIDEFISKASDNHDFSNRQISEAGSVLNAYLKIVVSEKSNSEFNPSNSSDNLNAEIEGETAEELLQNFKEKMSNCFSDMKRPFEYNDLLRALTKVSEKKLKDIQGNIESQSNFLKTMEENFGEDWENMGEEELAQKAYEKDPEFFEKLGIDFDELDDEDSDEDDYVNYKDCFLWKSGVPVLEQNLGYKLEEFDELMGR